MLSSTRAPSGLLAKNARCTADRAFDDFSRSAVAKTRLLLLLCCVIRTSTSGDLLVVERGRCPVIWTAVDDQIARDSWNMHPTCQDYSPRQSFKATIAPVACDKFLCRNCEEFRGKRAYCDFLRRDKGMEQDHLHCETTAICKKQLEIFLSNHVWCA